MFTESKSHSFIVIILSVVIAIGLIASAIIYFNNSIDKVITAQEIWAHFKALSLFAAGYAFRGKVT